MLMLRVGANASKIITGNIMFSEIIKFLSVIIDSHDKERADIAPSSMKYARMKECFWNSSLKGSTVIMITARRVKMIAAKEKNKAFKVMKYIKRKRNRKINIMAENHL